MDLQELLVQYQERLDSCQAQVQGITDLRARIGILLGCQERYESLITQARIALAVERLAESLTSTDFSEDEDLDLTENEEEEEYDMSGWSAMAEAIARDV